MYYKLKNEKKLFIPPLYVYCIMYMDEWIISKEQYKK